MANFVVKYQNVQHHMIVVKADTEEEATELVVQNSKGEIKPESWSTIASHYSGDDHGIDILGVQPLNI